MFVTLPSGIQITFMQAVKLATLIEQEGRDNCHWHLNDCGCCLTLHGADCAFVINPDGEETLYPGKGCSCE